jgi:AraC-like DNA-binding protein
MEVAESIPISGTAAMHHQAQQHVAGFVSSLGLLTMGRPLPADIRIAPHPIHGVAHLKPHLGEDVAAGPGRQLRMRIPDACLDLEFPWEPQPLPCGEADSLRSIQCGSMADSARILISGMIEDGSPSMDRLVLCAGRSRRTLQRMLAAEGTSFAALLDSVRHAHALAHLNEGHESVSSIAQGVGFRSVSSLSRAVRRWTNTSPRELRKDRRTA